MGNLGDRKNLVNDSEWGNGGMNNKTISGMKCILYLFGLLALSSPAQAASFDCAKAGTKVEKLICSDAELSKLDEELNAAYKTALQDGKLADTIRQAQKQWMKERNSCADANCVKQAYEARLASLAVTRATPHDADAAKSEVTAPPVQVKAGVKNFPKEADKKEGIKRVMAKEQFNTPNIASSAGQDFCGTFLEDFKEMRGMEFVEPIEKSVKYDDPVWNSYKARCPDLGLFETYDCEPKIADYLDELPQDEQKQAMKASCRHFKCTENFKLFRVDAKSEGGGVDDVFYCERMHGPLNFQDFPDMERFDTHGGYQLVDLKHCKNKGGAPSHDPYSYSYHYPLENYNGVIVYKGKHYTFDLSEVAEEHTLEKIEYILEVWGYARPDSKEQPKFLPKCFFSTVNTH